MDWLEKESKAHKYDDMKRGLENRIKAIEDAIKKCLVDTACLGDSADGACGECPLCELEKTVFPHNFR